jgi:hypothetical protein
MYRAGLKMVAVWAVCGLAGGAHGAPYTFGGRASQTIPDNNPLGLGYAFDFITAVPEAVQAAVGVFGVLLMVVILARSTLVRSRVKRWHASVVEWIDAV